MRKFKSVFFLYAAIVSADVLGASSDEIQVYDDAINKPGEASVDLHVNYVPSGVRVPAYGGEIPAHHNLRITPEFAYGLNKNWEFGFYLPVIRAATGDWHVEGAKVRLKYMANNPEQGFYWGINSELGASSHRTEESNWNFELRPIIGYKTDNWNLTVNPILGMALSGNTHTPTFSPALKVSRKVAEKTWFNVEHYSEFGPVNDLRSLVQETYLTMDTDAFGHNINFGVGHGWTVGSNDWTLKAILNFPF